MIKYTQKQLKKMVEEGTAIDITYKTHKEIQEIQDEERFFHQIGYAEGIYGCNGMLLQGEKTKKLYAITSRTSAIYSI